MLEGRAQGKMWRRGHCGSVRKGEVGVGGREYMVSWMREWRSGMDEGSFSGMDAMRSFMGGWVGGPLMVPALLLNRTWCVGGCLRMALHLVYPFFPCLAAVASAACWARSVSHGFCHTPVLGYGWLSSCRDGGHITGLLGRVHGTV